ncbi:MAG TPA: acylphosphatase [Phycisphaerales bacterium]|nr:acylphosphatase [Phycisphaerales bacterium]HRQ76802.1 acylphosphatase [Phycisphaerales bacterium]
MTLVRYTMTFTGRVQGVGFRATTAHLASGFAITGWVRNEPDGSVMCVAEGERKELDAFVQAIKQAMHRNLRDARVVESAALGGLSGFEIRR